MGWKVTPLVKKKKKKIKERYWQPVFNFYDTFTDPLVYINQRCRANRTKRWHTRHSPSGRFARFLLQFIATRPPY